MVSWLFLVFRTLHSVELLPDQLAAGQEIELAEVTVTGQVLTEDGGMEERKVTIPIRLTVGSKARVEPEIQKVKVLLEAAEGRREASGRADHGDVHGGSDVLRSHGQVLRENISLDPTFADEASDLDLLAAKLDSWGYDMMDKKYLMQLAYDSERSRRTTSELQRQYSAEVRLGTT